MNKQLRNIHQAVEPGTGARAVNPKLALRRNYIWYAKGTLNCRHCWPVIGQQWVAEPLATATSSRSASVVNWTVLL